jgi:hypothetical protein
MEHFNPVYNLTVSRLGSVLATARRNGIGTPQDYLPARITLAEVRFSPGFRRPA